MEPEKIIVIGGNAAGPSAAAKAKRTAPDSKVIMFEAGNYISTGTCELPYLISNEIKDYKKIIFYDEETFYKEKGVKAFLQHNVERIDKNNKKIIVRDLRIDETKEYFYDKLVLSTGSTAKKLPSLDYNLNNVKVLKTVRDYLQIKEILEDENIFRVGIIGSGYIGIELAEAFTRIGKKVLLFEKEKLPLPGADPEIQNLIAELLKIHEVEFYGKSGDVKFFSDENKIRKIGIDGRNLEVDLLISAVGFVPNNILAKKSGLEISSNGGIKIDTKMRTSDQHIFAAGDCVEVQNKVTNNYEYIPLATFAHDQGHIAGANAAGANEHYGPVIKNIALRIFNKALVLVGLNSAEAKKFGYNFETVQAVLPNLVKVMPDSKTVFGKIIYEKRSGHILGAQFLGENEAIGYGDLISAMIELKAEVKDLSRMNFNYTPPYSPFINILSVLGRKAKK